MYSSSRIDIHTLFYLIKRNILLVLILAILGGGAGYGISTYAITPIYSASADMIVNNKADGNNIEQVTSSDLVAANSLADTYSIILKSHVVIEQIIDDLQLPYSYSELSAKISIHAVDDTQVLRISAKDKNRDTALAIVTDMIKIAPDTIMNLVEAGSVKTVDQPWVSQNPIYPSVPKATLIGMAAGLALAALIILFRETSNNKIRNEEDLERLLGARVIGIIPAEENV